jgi:hypothetical protein
LHNRDEYIVSLSFGEMVFLATDLIELVPLDPDNEVHVETYRQSRNEPEMRATGAYVVASAFHPLSTCSGYIACEVKQLDNAELD